MKIIDTVSPPPRRENRTRNDYIDIIDIIRAYPVSNYAWLVNEIPNCFQCGFIEYFQINVQQSLSNFDKKEYDVWLKKFMDNPLNCEILDAWNRPLLNGFKRSINKDGFISITTVNGYEVEFRLITPVQLF